MLVPDSRWRVDNWPIVARSAMDRLHTTFREKGDERGRRVVGGRKAEKGCIDKDLPIPSRAGPRRPRDLIYEWDQTPEVVNGADWPSPVPLWYPVRPIVGWSLLSRPVSFLRVVPFLSLSPFFSSHSFLSEHRATSPPPPRSSSSISFFSLVLACPCWAEDAPILVACVLLGTYLSSIMRRRLSRDYCGQIGRMLS